jgi:hypothetical protein
VESVASMLLHKSQQLLITPLSCLLYSRCTSEKMVVSVETMNNEHLDTPQEPAVLINCLLRLLALSCLPHISNKIGGQMKRWYQHFFSNKLCACRIEGQSEGDQRSCGYLTCLSSGALSFLLPGSSLHKTINNCITEDHTANEGPVRIQYNCLSDLCIPRNETAGPHYFQHRIIILSPNFHIHVQYL